MLRNASTARVASADGSFHFQLWSDAQEKLAELAGGAPDDYHLQDDKVLDVADFHGIRASVAAIMQASRELTPFVAASSERAAREQARVAAFLEAEPPAYDFPSGAVTTRSSDTPLGGYTTAAIWEGFDAPRYLVKRLLVPSGLTVLFGESGSLKSTAAVALALGVASGREFFGLKTRQGGVLYVAGEGHLGVRMRVHAWLLEEGYDATSEQPRIFITREGANLFGAPEQLRATVQKTAEILGCAVDLVVIDTLAANFGAGGDENHANDMQLVISAARIAAPTAAILFIHHTGHGEAKRERGSSTLMAAADFRVQAEYDDQARAMELTWLKVKDDERPKPMQFQPRVVRLGLEDEDGEEISSIVLDHLDSGPAAAAPAPRGLGKNQTLALKVLNTLLAKTRKNLLDRGDDPSTAHVLMSGWQAALAARDMPRNRFHEALAELRNRGLIAVDGVSITVPAQAPQASE